MIIMGIDPGLTATGVGIINYKAKRPEYIDAFTIRTGKITRLEKRLEYIYDSLIELIEEFEPDACVVEEVFYSKNVKAAITMGHTRGVILLAAARTGKELISYSPREVKMAVVGNGGAAKNQVQFMVQKILKMDSKIPSLDASDALALAICHSQRIR